MKNSVLIRADSSFKIGSGHVFRCLTLANGLKKLNINVTFACLELDGDFISKIEKEYKVIKLEDNSIERLNSLINQMEFDFLIIDHYEITNIHERFLKQNSNITILSFDDMLLPHESDIILNQNHFAKRSDYKNLVNKNSILLLGENYSLIREQFFNSFKDRAKLKDRFKIFISFGGSDVKNGTLLTIKALLNLKFEYEAIVLLGKSYAYKDELNGFKSECIKIYQDVDDVFTLMNECDFAIIAGGTTSLETAFIKLPSMVVVTAQNQEKIAKYLDRQGLAFCVETIENLDENKLSNLINIFVSKKRDKIYQNLLNRQNYNGALNVANIIKKHLLKIAFVSDSDSWINQKIKRYLAKNQTLNIQTFHDYSLVKDFDVVFLLSYSKIIDEDSLKKNSLNLVVHASDLPDGKGMSPLSWQILEGKCEIIITIFEAISKLDSGDWFFKDVMKFTGYELIDELREMVDIKTFELIDKVLNNFSDLKRNKQIGDGKIYQRRTVLDSKLDINKSIKEQFNLLRIVDNEKYPAFFEIDGHKYILKIEKGS